jgi:hypothetical protein
MHIVEHDYPVRPDPGILLPLTQFPSVELKFGVVCLSLVTCKPLFKIVFFLHLSLFARFSLIPGLMASRILSGRDSLA